MNIVWHDLDLRTQDNPALFSLKEGPLYGLYILDPKVELLSASKVWLQSALKDLGETYEKLGSKLIILKGNPLEIFQDIQTKYRLTALSFNLRFDPYRLERDQKLFEYFNRQNIDQKIFNGNYLIHPKKIKNKQGKPYGVFTPFAKAVRSILEINKPLSVKKLQKPKEKLSSETIESLELLPKKSWVKLIANHWDISEIGAKNNLENFAKVAKEYDYLRNIPGQKGTSKLSPYLHFGQISPNTIWDHFKSKSEQPGIKAFLDEIIWREFANYFLYHFPKILKENWNQKFDTFPWKKNPKLFQLWSKGETGFPIVDAGMKELWQTGWLHNRVRMIVASFLVKDLFIHWKDGERWFFDTLFDADLASNIMNWQWVAGSGPDASPYFRIFNPVLQGEKFDPEGVYIKKYIPSLKNMPKKWIHKPFEAPQNVLDEAGVYLGKNYPKPIVDHAKARLKALEIFSKL